MEDYREKALTDICRIQRIADGWPVGARFRRHVLKAIRGCKIDYVATEYQKQKLILDAIAAGHRRFADIHRSTRLEKSELECLLQGLIEAGHVVETSERPVSKNGAGRPIRNYRSLVQ